MPEYELTPAAERDLLEIAIYTLQTWGRPQASRYEEALAAHLVALGRREAIVRRVWTHRPEVQVSRCGHHFVFSLQREGDCPLILAVLHESMDLVRRLRERLDPG